MFEMTPVEMDKPIHGFMAFMALIAAALVTGVLRLKEPSPPAFKDFHIASDKDSVGTR